MSRRLQYGILALLLAAACLGCHGNDRVLVIEKTGTFHTRQCARVSMARAVEMSVAEAERRGDRPCPWCQPLAAR